MRDWSNYSPLYFRSDSFLYSDLCCYPLVTLFLLTSDEDKVDEGGSHMCFFSWITCDIRLFQEVLSSQRTCLVIGDVYRKFKGLKKREIRRNITSMKQSIHNWRLSMSTRNLFLSFFLCQYIFCLLANIPLWLAFTLINSSMT